MTTEATHFSDSEDEHDSEHEQPTVISSEEYEEQIAKHLEQINDLTNQLESTNIEHRVQLEQVVIKRAEEIELFSKERGHHAAELLLRQKRIDFLMDKFMSK